MLKKILGLFILMILFTSTAFAADYYETIKVGETLTKACTAYGIGATNGNPDVVDKTIVTVNDDTMYIKFTGVKPGTTTVTLHSYSLPVSKTVEVTVQPQFLFAKGANVVLEPAALAYIADNAAKKFDADNYISNAFSYNTSIIDKNTTYSNTDKAYFDVKEVKGSTTIMLTEVNDPQQGSGLNHDYYVSVEDINPQITMELGDTFQDLANACINQKDNFGNEFVYDEELEASGYVPDDFTESYELIKEGVFTFILVQDDPKTSSNRIPYIFTVRVGNPTPITDINILKDRVDGNISSKINLKAENIYSVNEGADPNAVEFSSSDPSVAEVDSETGMVTPKKIGFVTITISSKEDSSISNSLKFYSCANKFALVNTDYVINHLYDDDDNIIDFNNLISVTSTDKSIFDVKNVSVKDESVTLFGKKAGIAKLECVTQTGTQYITVKCMESIKNAYKNTKVTISAEELTNGVKSCSTTMPFRGKIVKATAVNYKTRKEILCSVTSNQISFTPTEAGPYIIWLNSEEAGYDYYLYVEDKIAVKSVKLSNSMLSLKTGDKYQLSYTINPENATDKKVTWKSSNESVATVSQSGKVTATGRGEASITVITNDGSKKSYCKVYVKQPVTSVKLNTKKEELFLGDTYTLKATVLPSDANNKKVTWSSSDPSVATVNKNGKVTAVGLGKAVITVKTEDGNKKAICNIKVVQPVTGVSIVEEKIVIKKGATKKIVAIVSPKNAQYKQVIWTSSNSSNVKVDKNGIVKGLKSNTSAYIYVTTVDGGYTDKILVYVK